MTKIKNQYSIKVDWPGDIKINHNFKKPKKNSDITYGLAVK